MNLPREFRVLSQRIGSDPLLVQGAGGNTSYKADGRMWIKASGTLLADAAESDIFVAVDTQAALAELDGSGDGSCRSALIDPSLGLRPSIETTFHAMFPQKYVFHFHSVATICHAIAAQGRRLLDEKLDGLDWVLAPYRKPGIPLTKAIRDSVGKRNAQVVVLNNHGVIVIADTVAEVEHLINDIESRLHLAPIETKFSPASTEPAAGWKQMVHASPLACDPPATCARNSGNVLSGSRCLFGASATGSPTRSISSATARRLTGTGRHRPPNVVST